MGLRSPLVLALVTTGLLGMAQTASAQTTPIDGTVKNAAGEVIATFEGKFRFQRFQAGEEELLAVGKLSGEVRDTTGAVILRVRNTTVSLPVDLEQSGVGLGTSPVSLTCCQGSLIDCNVLHLVLGPLDLDLLGLELNLNQVILDLDANPAGGLLGQILSILCGLNLAGLLDNLLGSLPLLSAILNLLMILF